MDGPAGGVTGCTRLEEEQRARRRHQSLAGYWGAGAFGKAAAIRVLELNHADC